jgi:hypothetical protein
MLRILKTLQENIQKSRFSNFSKLRIFDVFRIFVLLSGYEGVSRLLRNEFSKLAVI